MSSSAKDFGTKVIEFLNKNRDATDSKITGIYLVAHTDDGVHQIMEQLNIREVLLTEKLIQHAATSTTSELLGLN